VGIEHTRLAYDVPAGNPNFQPHQEVYSNRIIWLTIPAILGRSTLSETFFLLLTSISPYVILNEAGTGFVLGAVGGGVWHGIKGARHAPKGLRLEGAIHAIKARSPITAGNFAVWMGLVSAFDCAITGYRQKEDMWNKIFSGAGAAGCLSARGGPRNAFAGAVAGGTVMGVFECFGVVFGRFLAEGNRPRPPPVPYASTS
ncbi:unnamed protein product, partial [Rhizoctonia solani]